MGAPDPDGARDVGGGDPLAVGGEARDGGLVRVLTVDGDVEGAVQVADDDGSAIAIQNRVRLWVAGD